MKLSKSFIEKLNASGLYMGRYTNVGYNGRVYYIRSHYAGIINTGMFGRYTLVECEYDNTYKGYTPIFFNR